MVVGASCGVIGNFLAALIAARWFRIRQGLVVGLLTAANAAGQLIFLPTMASVATHAGWRAMSLVLAGTVAVFVPLIALLMRDRPEDLGLAPYGGKTGPRPAPVMEGNPLTLAFRAFAESARSRDFWLIAGSYFVCGASTNGLIGTHLIPACVDHGLAEVTGAGLLAATGVFSFLGGTLSGGLSDHWDNRLLLAWYYGLRGLSLLYLPFAFDMSVYGLSLFTAFYGLDWIAGVLRISFGSYHEAFLSVGLLCFAATLMAPLIGLGGRRPDPAQNAVPAEQPRRASGLLGADGLRLPAV